MWMNQKNIRKILGPQKHQNPPKAPCGHVPPLFREISGKLVTILGTPIELESSNTYIQPRVWCGHCGWVKISEQQYREYRRLNDNGKRGSEKDL